MTEMSFVVILSKHIFMEKNERKQFQLLDIVNQMAML